MRTLTEHIVSGDQAVQLEVAVMDEPGAGGANHVYEISGMGYHHVGGKDLGSMQICFQNGPIKESGVNGITGEALLAIQIDRLRGFQAGQFACADNQESLEYTLKALECLQRRTLARIARGVEGTHEK